MRWQRALADVLVGPAIGRAAAVRRSGLLHELARYGWDVGALRGYGLTVHQLRRLLEAERWWARWYGQPTVLPRAPRLRGRVRAQGG